ncbi:MAG: hypothetical protein P9M07_08300 [Candidatus Aceula meridiana]|nr:hypothetical protein [Candidatus Aceula meridiana]
MLKLILKELRIHAPFTFFGAFTGIIVMMFFKNLPLEISYNIFYVLHPIHVVLSALVTASIYELHECGRINSKCIKGKCNFWILLVIGYAGSVGIATISDSIIPFVGEAILKLPNRGIHLGFIEKWWLVNPLALLGGVIAYYKPTTRIPHAGHVLLSTWASLFHVIMAAGGVLSGLGYVVVAIFIFFAVWIPCCVSDIVFPLLFVKKK